MQVVDRSGASQCMTNSRDSKGHYQDLSSLKLFRMGNKCESNAYGKGNI